jgi:hypothetical protein
MGTCIRWVGQGVAEVYFSLPHFPGASTLLYLLVQRPFPHSCKVLGNSAGLLGWVECSLKAGLLHEAEALGTSLPVNLKEGGQHIISVTSPCMAPPLSSQASRLLPHFVQISTRSLLSLKRGEINTHTGHACMTIDSGVGVSWVLGSLRPHLTSPPPLPLFVYLVTNLTLHLCVHSFSHLVLHLIFLVVNDVT